MIADRLDGLTVERARRQPHPVDRAATTLVRMILPGWRRSFPDLSPTVRLAFREARRLRGLSDEALRQQADELRLPLRRYGFRMGLTARAFALGIEATRRERGFVLHRVQVAGGLQILRGKLCEMATGEGKTVTAVLPAVAAALAGARVHVVTVNEYLAERDSQEVGAIHARLGLAVGLVRQEMPDEQKIVAYAQDITYVTSQSLAFDYLRDRLDSDGRNSLARGRVAELFGRWRKAHRLPGLIFAIVDEADSVLIDEARTPLVISGEVPGDEFGTIGRLALDLARSLSEPEHYEIDRANNRITLNEEGRARARTGTAAMPPMMMALTARDELIERALTALHLFHLGQHYIIADGEVQIVDESTGRVMPDRKWEHGLHQLIEIKEGCPPSTRRETLTQITFQRFFRKYLWFGGMTGTVTPVAREIRSVYDLAVTRIPTHARVQRRYDGATLCSSFDEKVKQICASATAMARLSRPILIGTRSVEVSERLKQAFDAASIPATLLNARQDGDEAEIVARAGAPGCITIATNMAGRGTDIKLAEEARQAGGLHVILTEFHESARVDRQLFGRAGRQGDPGSCEAIIAVDDALFMRFAPRLTALVAGMPGPLRRTLGSILARGLRIAAQNRAERLAAISRLQTLKADESLEKALSFARPG